MWADLSSRVSDARSEKRPLSSTSEPVNNDLETNSEQSNTVTVITSFDSAKIQKDAETAIEKDNKISMQKAETSVFYSNAERAVEGIKIVVAVKVVQKKRVALVNMDNSFDSGRRERDSNPRTRKGQRFSRPPHSTALPSLQIGCKSNTFFGYDQIFLFISCQAVCYSDDGVR